MTIPQLSQLSPTSWRKSTWFFARPVLKSLPSWHEWEPQSRIELNAIWNWKLNPGEEKEELEVMPGSEMSVGGKPSMQAGRRADEGLPELLSLIARLGTQVFVNVYVYVFEIVFVFVLWCAETNTQTHTLLQLQGEEQQEDAVRLQLNTKIMAFFDKVLLFWVFFISCPNMGKSTQSVI